MSDINGVLNALWYFFDTFGYVGIGGMFLVITVFPLPVPEELILLGVGYAIGHDLLDPFMVFFFCFGGIIVGDFYLYFLGRLLGKRPFELKPFKFFFTGRRIRKAERMVERYGDLGLVIGRFIWGLRAQIFFVCGIFKFSLVRFTFIDLLTALFEVVLFVSLGYVFKNELQVAVGIIVNYKNTSLFATIVFVVLIVLVLTFRRFRGRA